MTISPLLFLYKWNPIFNLGTELQSSIRELYFIGVRRSSHEISYTDLSVTLNNHMKSGACIIFFVINLSSILHFITFAKITCDCSLFNFRYVCGCNHYLFAGSKRTVVSELIKNWHNYHPMLIRRIFAKRRLAPITTLVMFWVKSWSAYDKAAGCKASQSNIDSKNGKVFQHSASS